LTATAAEVRIPEFGFTSDTDTMTAVIGNSRVGVSPLSDGPPTGGRTGFTLVELLATIAILALLMGILLPAVQIAREGARMASCSSRLRDLGLAANRFEIQRGSFPPSTVGAAFGSTRLQEETRDQRPSCPGLSRRFDGRLTPPLINMNGLVLLLPFVDQLAVYDASNRQQTFCARLLNQVLIDMGGVMAGNQNSNGNQQINETIMPTFICPSASGSRLGQYGNCRGAKTNYDFVTLSGLGGMGNVGIWRQFREHRECLPSLTMSGDESNARTDEVLDGLSNVLLFAETTSNGRCNGAENLWSFRTHSSYGVEPGFEMNSWITRHSNPCPWSVCCNVADPSRVRVAIGRLDTWGMPGSEHARGAFFAMADGSVRFIEEGVSPTIRSQLAHMADGRNPTLGN